MFRLTAAAVVDDAYRLTQSFSNLQLAPGTADLLGGCRLHDPHPTLLSQASEPLAKQAGRSSSGCIARSLKGKEGIPVPVPLIANCHIQP